MTVGIPGISQSVHNRGKLQVNFGLPDIYNDFFALNALKQSGGWSVANTTDTDWPSRLNALGYPQSMPSGASAEWRSRQLYLHGEAGDVWVVDWNNTATMGIVLSDPGGSLTESIISANRRQYTIVGAPQHDFDATNNPGVIMADSFLVSLRITSITVPPDDIRVYRAVDENLFSTSGATSMFRPDFLDRDKPFGSFRYMDAGRCNGTMNFLWDDHLTEAACNWTPTNFLKSDWWHGVATQTLNRYTVPTSFGGLTNGQKVTFWMTNRPTTIEVSSASVGSPTTLNFTAAHGLTTGAKIVVDLGNSGGTGWSTLGDKSNSTGLPPTYAVTVTDSDSLTIPFDSTGFGAPSTLRFHPVIEISDGVETKQCYRASLQHLFASETAIHGGPVTAVYDGRFDCFLLDGNSPNMSMGMPFSVFIELCNYCKAHPFLTIQWFADDDFWTNLATLTKNTLQKGLIPRFEPGNEIGWNTGSSFLQSLYAASDGQRRFNVNSYNQAYGARAAEVSDLIAAVWGSGADWQMVMGVQGVGSSDPTSRLESNASFTGGIYANLPINKCDVIAFGPYIYQPFVFSATAASYTGYVDAVDAHSQGDTTTAFNYMLTELTTPTNGAFGNLNQALDGWIDVHTKGWRDVARRYRGRTSNGVGITHYEGNIGTTGANSIDGGFPAVATSTRTVTVAHVRACWTEFLASSQAGTFMTNYLTRSAAAGVEYPSIYVITGLNTLGANWGVQPFNDLPISSPSTQYTAALNWNNGV